MTWVQEKQTATSKHLRAAGNSFSLETVWRFEDLETGSLWLCLHWNRIWNVKKWIWNNVSWQEQILIWNLTNTEHRACSLHPSLFLAAGFSFYISVHKIYRFRLNDASWFYIQMEMLVFSLFRSQVEKLNLWTHATSQTRQQQDTFRVTDTLCDPVSEPQTELNHIWTESLFNRKRFLFLNESLVSTESCKNKTTSVWSAVEGGVRRSSTLVKVLLPHCRNTVLLVNFLHSEYYLSKSTNTLSEKWTHYEERPFFTEL